MSEVPLYILFNAESSRAGKILLDLTLVHNITIILEIGCEAIYFSSCTDSRPDKFIANVGLLHELSFESQARPSGFKFSQREECSPDRRFAVM
jgi:hypothetical protein